MQLFEHLEEQHRCSTASNHQSEHRQHQSKAGAGPPTCLKLYLRLGGSISAFWISCGACPTVAATGPFPGILSQRGK